MKTIKELKAEKKKIKSITAVLISFIAIMLGASVFTTIKNGVAFNTFLPLFFIPLILINISKIKKLTKEIDLEESLK
ncbi:MAG: hypothetical protein ABI295_08450 [Xanthomarina sp.]